MITQLTTIFPHLYDHKDTFTAGGALTLALATSLMGCNRDKMAQELPQPGETAAQAQANQELAAVAQALARTLGADAAARQALKAEALKKFDGDYDVLYQPFVAGHAAFGQHVAEVVASTGPAGLTMPTLLGRIPNLNLSVPVNIDKWDAATYAPLVIFIPAGYDERTATRVKAYDQDGNVKWLDAKKAPSFPVVVVGPSERVHSDVALNSAAAIQANAPKQLGSTTSNAIDEPEITPDPDTPPEGSSGGTPANSTNGTYNPTFLSGPNCRVDKQIEYLRSMWMADVSEFEFWLLGDPEIRLQLLSPAGSGGTLSSTVVDGHYTMGRSTIEATYNCDARLFYWNRAFLGQVLAYVWLEEDFGDIADVKMTLGYPANNGSPSGSIEVTYKIANHDDEIGKGLIFFDECPSQGYYAVNSGGTEFRWVTQSRP